MSQQKSIMSFFSKGASAKPKEKAKAKEDEKENEPKHQGYSLFVSTIGHILFKTCILFSVKFISTKIDSCFPQNANATYSLTTRIGESNLLCKTVI